MEKKKIITSVSVYDYAELSDNFRLVVDEAKSAALKAYAPYSRFQVGAAVLMNNGEIVTGNNQENVSYPSGLCAERVTMFYANAHYPDVAPKILAIAAYTDGDYTDDPITPCGACRQVLAEAEMRFGKNIAVVLYGNKKIYILDSVKELLPMTFEKKVLT
jgi:cytidine deaminase